MSTSSFGYTASFKTRPVAIHQTCFRRRTELLAVAPSVFNAEHIFDPCPELSDGTRMGSEELASGSQRAMHSSHADKRQVNVHERSPHGVDVQVHQRERRESHRPENI